MIDALPRSRAPAVVRLHGLEEFFTDFASSGRDPVEMRQDARILRDAYERLGEIVHAITALNA